MYKAKALIGEKAGEAIYAKDPGLTHNACKLWKIYCPECKQFLYFSKSKEPDKRRSCFGHYDYEDKRCPERTLATNQSNQSASFAESHEQDLETAELFVEKVFYAIDPEYFQSVNQQENEGESQQVTDAAKWFKDSLPNDCNNWIRYYCQTTGFLDWNDPEREISYLMDWLYVLARREDILKNLTHYFASKYSIKESEIYVISKNFGLSGVQAKDGILTCLLILHEIIHLLSTQLSPSLSVNLVDSDQFFTHILDSRITPNRNKMIFKSQIIDMSALSYYAMSNLLLINIPRTKKRRIYFRKGSTNLFSYIIYNDLKKKGKEKRNQSLSDRIVVDARPNTSLDEKLAERKSQGLNTKKEIEKYELMLCVDSDDNLVLKGRLDRKSLETAAIDFSKIIFTQSWGSMLFLLREGLVSVEVAEKLAQLALKFEYGDLTSTEALKKFKELSGYRER